MRLAPTPEQQEVKDAVRRFCVEQITPERLLAWDRDPLSIDVMLFRAVAELGWFGLGLPTAVNGSGLGMVDVACLVEECGRGLVPHVVIDAIRGALALARLDAGNMHLAAIARGDMTVALAFDEKRASDPAAF